MQATRVACSTCLEGGEALERRLRSSIRGSPAEQSRCSALGMALRTRAGCSRTWRSMIYNVSLSAQRLCSRPFRGRYDCASRLPQDANSVGRPNLDFRALHDAADMRNANRGGAGAGLPGPLVGPGTLSRTPQPKRSAQPYLTSDIAIKVTNDALSSIALGSYSRNNRPLERMVGAMRVGHDRWRDRADLAHGRRVDASRPQIGHFRAMVMVPRLPVRVVHRRSPVFCRPARRARSSLQTSHPQQLGSYGRPEPLVRQSVPSRLPIMSPRVIPRGFRLEMCGGFVL